MKNDYSSPMLTQIEILSDRDKCQAHIFNSKTSISLSDNVVADWLEIGKHGLQQEGHRGAQANPEKGNKAGDGSGEQVLSG